MRQKDEHCIVAAKLLKKKYILKSNYVSANVGEIEWNAQKNSYYVRLLLPDVKKEMTLPVPRYLVGKLCDEERKNNKQGSVNQITLCQYQCGDAEYYEIAEECDNWQKGDCGKQGGCVIDEKESVQKRVKTWQKAVWGISTVLGVLLYITSPVAGVLFVPVPLIVCILWFVPFADASDGKDGVLRIPPEKVGSDKGKQGDNEKELPYDYKSWTPSQMFIYELRKKYIVEMRSEKTLKETINKAVTDVRGQKYNTVNQVQPVEEEVASTVGGGVSAEYDSRNGTLSGIVQGSENNSKKVEDFLVNDDKPMQISMFEIDEMKNQFGVSQDEEKTDAFISRIAKPEEKCDFDKPVILEQKKTTEIEIEKQQCEELQTIDKKTEQYIPVDNNTVVTDYKDLSNDFTDLFTLDSSQSTLQDDFSIDEPEFSTEMPESWSTMGAKKLNEVASPEKYDEDYNKREHTERIMYPFGKEQEIIDVDFTDLGF